MSHTYTNLLTHVIFSTKDREPLITAALHDDLLAYLGGIVRELGGALRAANARPDHVHRRTGTDTTFPGFRFQT